MGNLHICYDAFFAGKFAGYGSQICNGPHDVIPKSRQVVNALEVPDNL